MNMKSLLIAVLSLAGLAGAIAVAQTPASSQAQTEPTLEQMRKTVASLRGNRIETPNNYDSLNAEQKAYVKSILSGPRGGITGPLGVMMVSPALGDLNQKAIAYARFSGREGFGSVTPKLNELAILIVAKHWSAEYVWNAHHRAGVSAGLPVEVVEAIRVGKRPAAMEKDVEAVYNFANGFITTRQVSDATLQAAKAVLGGDRGVVDLVGTMGLYQISSMMVAMDETPLPQGTKPFLH